MAVQQGLHLASKTVVLLLHGGRQWGLREKVVKAVVESGNRDRFIDGVKFLAQLQLLRAAVEPLDLHQFVRGIADGPLGVLHDVHRILPLSEQPFIDSTAGAQARLTSDTPWAVPAAALIFAN